MNEALNDFYEYISKNEVSEGRWAMDKNSAKIMLKELKAMQKKYFSKVGDDAVWNGIDRTIQELQDILYAE